ncbi:MAG: 3-phosphoshikimate 1-carboxyvinyltransferase [Endomicrobium sp.]|jgi:3-phosphoshikimate 1-carboxyvinyltransferase|nr:3-phosphoshikimate 1-carboxyvinyltransferase [Endomicrobium sp.]
MNIELKKVNKIKGIIEVPADKSITHRAVMLSSLAKGNSVIRNYLPSQDCMRTIEAFKLMGAEIKADENVLYVKGAGLRLQKPAAAIDAGNSGTTARLLSGILSGQNFESLITGDESLSKRPMKRIIEPLSKMGAQIKSNNDMLPLKISGKSPLKAIRYENDKSTAQVKSAVLFAGLYADGATTYFEPVKSRDHSERMLKAFGAKVETDGNCVTVHPVEKLNAMEIDVPGDISSAAFFIASALIVPDSELVIKNVGINPTRDGFIEILKKMGADITFDNMRNVSGEPVCDINVKYSKLKSADIDFSVIPRMIDEIPIFALIAAQADGITRITGAKELRVKESDRIAAIYTQFRKLGIEIEELEDGLIINGCSVNKFQGGTFESFKDHRIAMTLAVASLIAENEITIQNADCVNISFPDFYERLKSVCR